MDDLDGDGFDEIAKVGDRQTPDEEFVASGGQLPRYRETRPSSPVTGPPIKKLENLRWTGHLKRDEERNVILVAKAGDPAAKRRLVECFQKAVRKIAGNGKYGGPPFNERLSAAWVGFWKAFDRYDPRRNNGFWAYAAKFVRGAVVDCVTDWHYRGHKDESRAARKNRAEHRPVHAQYNVVEGSHYDLEGREPISAPIAGCIAADEDELLECDGSGGKVTDAHWARIVAGRAVPTNWPNTHQKPEPCKPISRARYEEDRIRAYRFDTAAYIQRRLSQRLINLGRNLDVPGECFGVDENPRRNGGRYPKKLIGAPGFQIPRFEGRDDGVRFSLYVKGPVLGDKFANKDLSSEYLAKYPTPDKYKTDALTRGDAPPLGIIGWLAVETDIRAMRRLVEIGRQKYALELAAKVRTEVEPLFPLPAKSYSVPINTATTAVAPFTVSATKMNDSEKENRDRHKPFPFIYDYKTKQNTWRRYEDVSNNANRRMATLVVAVDNEDPNGYQHNNTLCPRSDLHCPHGIDNRDIRKVG